MFRFVRRKIPAVSSDDHPCSVQITQYFDLLKDVGTSGNASTVFLNHSPGKWLPGTQQKSCEQNPLTLFHNFYVQQQMISPLRTLIMCANFEQNLHSVVNVD